MNEVVVTQELAKQPTIFERVVVPTVKEVYDGIPPSNGVTKEMYRIGVSKEQNWQELKEWAQSIDMTPEGLRTSGEYVDGLDILKDQVGGLLQNDEFLAHLYQNGIDQLESSSVREWLNIKDETVKERLVSILVEGIDPEIRKLAQMKLSGQNDQEIGRLAERMTGMMFTFRDSPMKTPRTFSDGIGGGLAKELYPQAEAVERGKYLLHLLGVTKLIWQEYFSPLALEPEVKYLEMFDPKHMSDGSEADDPFCTSNGGWNSDPFMKEISITSAIPLGKRNMWQLYDSVTESSSRVWTTRKVDDIRVMSHEYAHAVFDTLTGSTREGEISNSLYQTFTEGFAMVMEYLTLKVMKDHPEEFGLKPIELEKIQMQREKRANRLDGKEGGKRDHYGDGLVGVWWPIFESAKHDGQKFDIQQSLKAMREFGEQLDSRILTSTSRYDEQIDYTSLVSAADPEAWLKVVRVSSNA